MNTCGNCKYYVAEQNSAKGVKYSYGECRFNPPAVVSVTDENSGNLIADSACPEIGQSYWCGKHENRTAKKKGVA